MTPDEIRLLAIGFACGVVFCGVIAVLGWLVAPWVRALLTRVPLTAGDLIGMRLRGTPAKLIVDAAVSLRMQGRPIDRFTISRVEQVYLEDRKRHADSRSLADAVAARAEAS